MYQDSFPRTSSQDTLDVSMPGATSLSRSNSGLKRKTDISIKDDSKSNKKRFIWPTSLHQHFIAAVFDIGLRSASIKELLSTINDPSDSTLPVSVETYASQLHKLRLFRDPSLNKDHQAYYRPHLSSPMSSPSTEHKDPPSASRRASFDGSVEEKFPSSRLHAPTHNTGADDTSIPVTALGEESISDSSGKYHQSASIASSYTLSPQAPTSHPISSIFHTLTQQLTQMSQSIYMQELYVQYLQGSLYRQKDIYSHLLEQVGGVCPEAIHMHHFQHSLQQPPQQNNVNNHHNMMQHQQQQPEALSHHPIQPLPHDTNFPDTSMAGNGVTAPPAHASRTELSMIHEMREQMSLHRKLLLKRDEVRGSALPMPNGNIPILSHTHSHVHSHGIHNIHTSYPHISSPPLAQAHSHMPVYSNHASDGTYAYLPSSSLGVFYPQHPVSTPLIHVSPSHDNSRGHGNGLIGDGGVGSGGSLSGGGVGDGEHGEQGANMGSNGANGVHSGGAGVGIGVSDLEAWEEDTLFFFLDDEFAHSPPNSSTS